MDVSVCDRSLDIFAAFDSGDELENYGSQPLSQEIRPGRSSIRPSMSRKSMPGRRISWAVTTQFQQMNDDGTAVFGDEEIKKSLSIENKKKKKKGPDGVEDVDDNKENIPVKPRIPKEKYLNRLLKKYYKTDDIDDCTTIMRTAMNQLSNLNPREDFHKFMKVVQGCDVLSKNDIILQSFLKEFLKNISLEDGPVFLELLDAYKINAEDVIPGKILENNRLSMNFNSTRMVSDQTDYSFRNLNFTKIVQEEEQKNSPAQVHEASMELTKVQNDSMSKSLAFSVEITEDMEVSHGRDSSLVIAESELKDVSELSIFDSPTTFMTENITNISEESTKSFQVLDTQNASSMGFSLEKTSVANDEKFLMKFSDNSHSTHRTSLDFSSEKTSVANEENSLMKFSDNSSSTHRTSLAFSMEKTSPTVRENSLMNFSENSQSTHRTSLAFSIDNTLSAVPENSFMKALDCSQATQQTWFGFSMKKTSASSLQGSEKSSITMSIERIDSTRKSHRTQNTSDFSIEMDKSSTVATSGLLDAFSLRNQSKKRESSKLDFSSSKNSFKRTYDEVEKAENKQVESFKLHCSEQNKLNMSTDVISPEPDIPIICLNDIKPIVKSDIEPSNFLRKSLAFPMKTVKQSTPAFKSTNVEKKIEIDIDFNKTTTSSNQSLQIDVSKKLPSVLRSKSLGFDFRERLLEKIRRQEENQDVEEPQNSSSLADSTFEDAPMETADLNTSVAHRSMAFSLGSTLLFDASRNKSSVEKNNTTELFGIQNTSRLSSQSEQRTFDQSEIQESEVTSSVASHESILDDIPGEQSLIQNNQDDSEEEEEENKAEITYGNQLFMNISNLLKPLDDSEEESEDFSLPLRAQDLTNSRNNLDESAMNFTNIFNSTNLKLGESTEKIMNFTLSPFEQERILENLNTQCKFVNVQQFKHLNVRIQYLSNEECEIRLLWGTFQIRIFFDEVVDLDACHRKISRIETFSIARNSQSELSDLMVCPKEKPLFMNDIRLGLIHKKMHNDILVMAHDFVEARIQERGIHKRDFNNDLQKYPDSTKLNELIEELCEIGDQASEIYMEIRLLYINDRTFKQLPRDSGEHFCFIKKVAGYNGRHFVDMKFSFNFHNYPFETIHPEIVVPEEYKDIYSVDEVFKQCLYEKIKPGTDQYLTRLVNGAEIFMKAIKRTLRNKRLYEQQQAELGATMKKIGIGNSIKNNQLNSSKYL